MLLPQQGMEGQQTCSGMAASGPGEKNDTRRPRDEEAVKRLTNYTVRCEETLWKKWRIQAGKLCRKTVRLHEDKKKSEINKLLRAN